MKVIVKLSLISLVFPWTLNLTLAQSDTTFFDQNGKYLSPAKRAAAVFYELHGFSQIESGQVMRYRMDHTKYSFRTYADYQYNGQFVDYHPNENIKKSGFYKDGKLTGLIKERYENGNMKQSIFYGEEGEKMFLASLPDGTSMVSGGNGHYNNYDERCDCTLEGDYAEGLKTGTWTGFRGDRQLFREEYEPAGFLKQGTRYDKSGIATEYVSLNMEAGYGEGPEDWTDFLRKNLKYPKTATRYGIEGKVVVVFDVVADGVLENVKIWRGIGGGCDEEARRIVLLSAPKWRAKRERGKLVKTEEEIQLIFRLK